MTENETLKKENETLRKDNEAQKELEETAATAAVAAVAAAAAAAEELITEEETGVRAILDDVKPGNIAAESELEKR